MQRSAETKALGREGGEDVVAASTSTATTTTLLAQVTPPAAPLSLSTSPGTGVPMLDTASIPQSEASQLHQILSSSTEDLIAARAAKSVTPDLVSSEPATADEVKST